MIPRLELIPLLHYITMPCFTSSLVTVFLATVFLPSDMSFRPPTDFYFLCTSDCDSAQIKVLTWFPTDYKKKSDSSVPQACAESCLCFSFYSTAWYLSPLCILLTCLASTYSQPSELPEVLHIYPAPLRPGSSRILGCPSSAHLSHGVLRRPLKYHLLGEVPLMPPPIQAQCYTPFTSTELMVVCLHTVSSTKDRAPRIRRERTLLLLSPAPHQYKVQKRPTGTCLVQSEVKG